ncbi:MAG TPA: hypothetical protein VF661_10735 [Actinomycetales bacterium]|jgi:CspA family cold shock protein
MVATARVREWHDDEGWGVLDSDETPGGCWAHYSALAVDGYRTAAAGDAVLLEWEAPGQDGHDYRAVRFWPVGSEPAAEPSPVTDSPAYGSTLEIRWADGRVTEGPPPARGAG